LKPSVTGDVKPSVTAAHRLARLRRLSGVLDSAVRIPGTRFRFGLDALLGVIPGVGDVAGGALSGYVILEAARAGASKLVLLRMLLNVAIDTVVGAVPLLGDLFDAGWKSNSRNVALLERYLELPAPTKKASGAFVAMVIGTLVLLAAGAVLLAVAVARLLMSIEF